MTKRTRVVDVVDDIVSASSYHYVPRTNSVRHFDAAADPAPLAAAPAPPAADPAPPAAAPAPPAPAPPAPAPPAPAPAPAPPAPAPAPAPPAPAPAPAPAPTPAAPAPVPSAPPKRLLQLGNERAAHELYKHLRDSAQPLLLHGPVGCGKTHMVEAMVEHMHMRPVVFDGAETDDHQQLTTWIQRARKARNLGGRRSVVVLDDLEGFSERQRTEIVKLCVAPPVPHTNPMVLVCHSARDPMWKALSQLPTVRMRAPSVHELRRWCVEAMPWVSARDGSQRVGMRGNVVDEHLDVLRSGDVRRVRLAIQFHVSMGERCATTESESVFQNGFDACRKLFTHKTSVEAFLRRTAPMDDALLQYHATQYTTDMHALARCLDTFSVCDAHLPDRFETRGLHEAFQREAVVRATALTVRIPSVGALHPPPRAPKRTRPAAESPSEALNRCV